MRFLVSWFMAALVAACVILMSVVVVGCDDDAATPSSGSSEHSVYICPMRCVVEGQSEPYTQSEAGSCPVCGMDLEPGEPAGQGQATKTAPEKAQ